MYHIRKILFSKYTWILTGVGLVLLFYYLFDPMSNRFMPQCLFHKATGLQCMGCGSQRVVHSLLHGNLIEAFEANALLVSSIPFLLFLGYVEMTKRKHPRLYARVHSPVMIIIIACVLLIWVILRNIFGL